MKEWILNIIDTLCIPEVVKLSVECRFKNPVENESVKSSPLNTQVVKVRRRGE